jgi:hypothetical protein
MDVTARVTLRRKSFCEQITPDKLVAAYQDTDDLAFSVLDRHPYGKDRLAGKSTDDRLAHNRLPGCHHLMKEIPFLEAGPFAALKIGQVRYPDTFCGKHDDPRVEESMERQMLCDKNMQASWIGHPFGIKLGGQIRQCVNAQAYCFVKTSGDMLNGLELLRRKNLLEVVANLLIQVMGQQQYRADKKHHRKNGYRGLEVKASQYQTRFHVGGDLNAINSSLRTGRKQSRLDQQKAMAGPRNAYPRSGA